MKSLIVDGSGRLFVDEVPKPAIDANHALVQMEACGVCNGTDLKLIHRTFKGYGDYPAILGHEGVGRVIEVGANVTSFAPGDRVLLPFLEEKAGPYHLAWGAYSEYAVVGDWRAMARAGQGAGMPGYNEGYRAQTVVPQSVSPVDAAMIVTFREVLSAIRRFGMESGQSVVIIGAGPVGLCFTRFCRLLGMGPIVVFDRHEEKLAEALRLGADAACHTGKTDMTEAVRAHCPDGADFIIDAAGVNALLNQALQLIKYNGKVCCYGISPELGMQLDWSRAPYNWTLQFVQWPSKQEEADAHSQILSWMELGVLNPADFISDVIPFANILDAFRLVEEKRAKGKIIIQF